MSATTTTKPRAKAAPKGSKSPLQTRLDAIFSNLKQGQEKLQLAHESVEKTDPGDAAEVLLRAVLEDMLPAALSPIQQQPISRQDMEAAYTGMFPALAAIDGVVALSVGQVIESTLREAWVLLDQANTWMDFGDMKDALPEAAEAPTAQVQKPTSPYSAEFAFDAHCRATEAEAILDSRMHDMNSGAAYGALTLVGIAKAKLAAVEAHATRDACDDASSALHEAIEVLGLVTNDHSDLVAEGAFALLELAKRLIDDNVGALQ